MLTEVTQMCSFCHIERLLQAGDIFKSKFFLILILLLLLIFFQMHQDEFALFNLTANSYLVTKIIPMYLNNIIPVRDILVRKEISETHFACNLKECKGACCTMEGKLGAPLEAEEILKIDKILEIVKQYLPAEHLIEIEKKGFYDKKGDDYFTRSLDNRACVFVYYKGDIAKCSIEKACIEGKADFRKPISCHLFPIRISNFGSDVLRYEKFSECTSALENGTNEQIKLIDFCKDSLTRLYGAEWYSSLKERFTE